MPPRLLEPWKLPAESWKVPGLLFAAVAVVYWPGILSAAVAPRWAVLYIGIPLALLLAPGRTFWLGIPSWLWVGWLAISTASVAWSPDPLAGINSVAHLLVLFGAFTVGGLYGVRGAIYGTAIGLIPSLVMAPWDAGGLFWNKNVLAELSCLVAVFFLVEKQYWLSVPYLFGVAWTNSRAALIVLALTALCRLPKLWRMISLSVVFILVLLFSITQLWGLSSLTTRAAMWVSAVAFSTFFGHGIGSFAFNYPFWEHPHNEILFAVYEIGVFAIIPCSLFLFVWSMSPPVHSYPDYYQNSSLAPLATLSAFGLFALVAFPLSDPATGALSAAMAGYLARSRHSVRFSQLVRRMAFSFGVRSAGYPR